MEIFLRPLDLLIHIGNVLILFFFLRYLLYKPVTKFLRERDERLQAERDEIRQSKEEVKSQMQHYSQLISDAREESAQIVKRSNEMAREREDEIIAAAKAEAEEVVNRAEREAKFVRAHAREKLRNEIADIAVDIAAKIVKREITAEDNKDIIKDFFDKDILEKGR